MSALEAKRIIYNPNIVQAAEHQILIEHDNCFSKNHLKVTVQLTKNASQRGSESLGKIDAASGLQEHASRSSKRTCQRRKACLILSLAIESVLDFTRNATRARA